MKVMPRRAEHIYTMHRDHPAALNDCLASGAGPPRTHRTWTLGQEESQGGGEGGAAEVDAVVSEQISALDEGA